jgi:spore germination protein
MRPLDYGNEEISHKEICYAVASMLIGAGILTLPRSLANVTQTSDAWISILLAGGVTIFFTWVVAKLASQFPKKTFLEYATTIVSRPIAVILTLLFATHMVMFAGYETRVVGTISVMYLFDKTPIEAIAVLFLLGVNYAVYGSTAAILRLNLMFLPIILGISLMISFMNLGTAEVQNMKPVFTTSIIEYLRGVKISTSSYLGFEILLFYIAFMKRTEKAAKAAIVGVSVTTLLYLIFFLFTIAVFGHESTKNLVTPTVELAKEVQVPGEFFERFESVFFTVWIMTLFNTTAMAFNVALIALQSVFPKVKKVLIISILSPLIFLIGFSPPNWVQLEKLGDLVSYNGIVMGMAVPLFLYFMAKIRGIKGNG